eukprot:5063383-Prymnesium_polylepis.1
MGERERERLLGEREPPRSSHESRRRSSHESRRRSSPKLSRRRSIGGPVRSPPPRPRLMPGGSRRPNDSGSGASRYIEEHNGRGEGEGMKEGGEGEGRVRRERRAARRLAHAHRDQSCATRLGGRRGM